MVGHEGGVNSVPFSPDGRRIASGSDDRTVRIWDADRGQDVIGPLRGHAGAIYSVAYSPDGAKIVSGSEDGTIRIWDPRSGAQILGPLRGHVSWVRLVT